MLAVVVVFWGLFLVFWFLFEFSVPQSQSTPPQCAWTPDGKHVGAGSADRNVHIWETSTGKTAYLLPGHKVRVWFFSCRHSSLILFFTLSPGLGE
jgi:WD40 repeat protein